jgi:uncharacterized membrane protein
MIRGGEPWKNTQILFTLGLVFLCGSIAGALVYRASSQPVKAFAWNDNNKQVTLNRLQKELQLTPDQTAEIETILDDFTMYYQMLQAQMDEVRANGKSGMEQVLNEEQRKKFGRIMHDFRDKQIP